uniref:Uncharacterized protein n=1 Tax=Anopheles atroparvus TaxID=41427 RepID=A0A182JNA9_ANOAO
MDNFPIVIFVVLACIVVYLGLVKRFQYWVERGVPQSKPHLIFGNMREVNKSLHIGEGLQQLYDELKGMHPFGGFYIFTKPVALITDLELLRCVFVKDFEYFHDRGTYYNEKDDPLSAHLFNIEGLKWKTLRNKISPTFTSGKMKMMFPTIVAAGQQFREFMEQTVQDQVDFELTDVLSRYTTDVIGSCAFGIECNSIRNPDAKFRVMGRKIFQRSRGLVRLALMNAVPSLARKIGIKVIEPDVAEFFMGAVRDTIRYREENNVQRNDFMDILIRMRQREDSISDHDTFTLNEIAAQAFVFFLAGFETSSSLMAFTLHELAMNPEIQEQGRRCVEDALERHDGELTYEASMEMHFLERILKETLRKYPPISVHFRKISKTYRVPRTDTVLDAGTTVMIPVLGIHRDPDHFPDPDRFDPDRFTPEEEAKRHPYAWTPFGEGPRICVGQRFGMMQARIGLAYLLTSFRFAPGKKSVMPLKLNIKIPVLTPEGGLWLCLERLQKAE